MPHWVHILLMVVVVLGVLAVGFLVGRKWRKDYQRALDQWQNLQSKANANASAVASSHGNQVVVNVDSGSQSDRISRDLWFPDSVRARLDSGAATGAEALTDGNDGAISEPVVFYRPSRVSRVLFGPGRSDSRGELGRESGSSSGGG